MYTYSAHRQNQINKKNIRKILKYSIRKGVLQSSFFISFFQYSWFFLLNFFIFCFVVFVFFAKILQDNRSSSKILQDNHSSCKILQDNHFLQDSCKILQDNHLVSTGVVGEPYPKKIILSPLQLIDRKWNSGKSQKQITFKNIKLTPHTNAHTLTQWTNTSHTCMHTYNETLEHNTNLRTHTLKY